MLELGSASESRDSVTDGVSKRITLPWTQKQSGDIKKVKFHNGKKYPIHLSQ